jgi:hypothetical protein
MEWCMKMAVMWDIAPCILVEVVGRFRGVYCFHHQGDRLHGAISQKTVIFILGFFTRELCFVVLTKRM